MIYRDIFKRVYDLFISAITMIILCPIFVLLAILIRIKLGKDIIFKQKRPGKNGRIFTIYKFRTMTNKTDENGFLLPDKDRLTKFGVFLRSTSLDELPELWNIVKGDMSLVGPRPQLIRDMVFMSDYHKRRHSVRPGLTGLAQISGRNDIDWDYKLDLDIKYLDKLSLIFDLKIIISTIFKVIKKENVNTSGMATSEDYGDYLLRCGKVSRLEYEKLQRLALEYERDFHE